MQDQIINYKKPKASIQIIIIIMMMPKSCLTLKSKAQTTKYEIKPEYWERAQ